MPLLFPFDLLRPGVPKRAMLASPRGPLIICFIQGRFLWISDVDFYCGFAGSNFRSNLLVEHSRDHQGHYLPLSHSQSVIAPLQIVDLGLFFLRDAVTLEGLLNCVQQILVPERFCQKFHSARL